MFSGVTTGGREFSKKIVIYIFQNTDDIENKRY